MVIGALLLACMALPFNLHAKTTQKVKVKACVGQYALCAASTGTPTGRDIRVRAFDGTWQTFPEALVVCPILKGVQIAGLNSGTMGNSCKAPKGKVYSTYSPQGTYPQEANGFNPDNQTAKFQECAPQNTTIHTTSFPNGATQNISQCWSMVCDINPVSAYGVPTANCHCPIGATANGELIAQNVPSITQAGQGDATACSQNPVSFPLINKQ